LKKAINQNGLHIAIDIFSNAELSKMAKQGWRVECDQRRGHQNSELLHR